MDIIEILKAVLFGIVEGITEWLPISSTGHMILLNEFVTLNVSEDFWEMFLVVIQLGAILAVVLLFWNKIFPFHFKEKPVVQKDIFVLWFKILVACVPAAVVGLAFDDVLDALFYNPWCVAVALIVFGIAFILIENRNKKMTPRITELGDITYQTALMIGVFQLIAAVFPGTSRSGATIVGALRRVKNRGGGVYFLSGDSRHAGGKPVKALKVRFFFYGGGACHSGGRDGGGFCGVCGGDPFPDGLHQKA